MKKLLCMMMFVVATCGQSAENHGQGANPTHGPAWDTYSDTWVGTDALDRSLPGYLEVGPPRQEKFVGLFYFLWLGAHVNGGPYDIAKIKAVPTNNPPWGPMYAPHHWGESVFGYYLTEDPYVLRKHAQMLADAGVDVIIFDVTNQVTYKKNYLELLRVFDDVRRKGGKTPQVAFLCPFWDPPKVVRELWRDLYQPGLYSHLWFRWEGKPLILADSSKLPQTQGVGQGDIPTELKTGETLGQSFEAKTEFTAVGGCFPTWQQTNSALTLSLFRDGPGGDKLASRRFTGVGDNDWTMLELPKALPPGRYYLEASAPEGQIGWWGSKRDRAPSAFAQGKPCPGTRSWRIQTDDAEAREMQRFFTFRKPQADYFRGPTQVDMWSWLEVYPQHVFKNSRGEKEQMSVGVAQNAVGSRLGSMSEPGVRGRSYHKGATATSPLEVLHGYNFAEQFEHALKEDPKFIFITGWNEWIAGRHPEFAGVKGDALFPDEYDQENSRDIEPMRAGHGDNYYYQMVSYVRRFKGVRSAPKAGPEASIRLKDGFEQWGKVGPEYRDDIGDTEHRNFAGFNNCTRYTNNSGRNDLVLMKVARDRRNVYFYAKTQGTLTPSSDSRWMMLLIDIDCNHRTGWEGYDFMIHRSKDGCVLERNTGGWNWVKVGKVECSTQGAELQFAVPRKALGLKRGGVRFDFKWADNVPGSGDIQEFITEGDVAPNGRFNYRFED